MKHKLPEMFCKIGPAVLLCLLPFSLFAGFRGTDKEGMLSDLETLRNEIEINYAPADWKKQHFGWNFNEEIGKAQQKILKEDSLSPRQYQQILRDIFNSFQDLHAGINFYSTEFAILPFLIQGVNHHYYVVWIDPHWVEDHDIPLEVGDEVLFFNDESIDTLIAQIQVSAYGPAENQTHRHLSELQLTIRDGASLPNVPHGNIKITYRKTNEVKPRTFCTEWKYLPEEIDNDFSIGFAKIPLLGQHPFFHKSRALPLYSRLKQHSPEYRSTLLGDKKSPFPAFGPVTWKSDSKIFDAYVYTLKGKSIGYVRIPDFYAEAEEAEEFRKIIAVMQGRTKALIVDVMNNPGGIGFYAYSLASMLTDKPLKNLPEEMTITHEDMYFALQDIDWLSDIESDADAIDIFGKDVGGFPVDKQLALSILSFANFIKEQFKAGKTITDPYPMEGLEYIQPHRKTRYTKPIVVLTNSLSISCGDLLPALLQDNQRAKILGEKTGGAGGFVLKKKYSNRFGVADFTLTGSLMYRLNSEPLENLGVTPDFPYEFTSRDYTANYQEFIQFVNQVMTDLICF